MNYSAFVRLQQDQLIRSFLDDPANCFIGIPGLDAFQKRHFGAGSWRPLGAVSPSIAVIYNGPSATNELWLKPYDKAQTADGSYRKLWATYVETMQVDGISDQVDGRTQNVDHLLPETFAARQGYALVRVVAVDTRSNLTVGSTIEKSMANRTNPGCSFLADWFTIAKASCFRGSFSAKTTARDVMSDLRRHLATRGFPLPAHLQDIDSQSMEAILEWSRGG